MKKFGEFMLVTAVYDVAAMSMEEFKSRKKTSSWA